MNFDGPFILLVEDNKELRDIIERNLGALGYLVFSAGTFAEATEKMAVKPHLMILDIGLPDATGWDVAGWLERFTAPPPIIVISGQRPDMSEIRHFQPVAFFPKPFDIDELLDLVQQHAPLKSAVG